MRFGTWRGVAPLVAFALATAIATGGVATATVRAGIICHTIPREVVAVDVNTGGPFLAPPVPYGCYAKDCLGTIAEACGLVRGCLGNACGLLHGCCPGCHGSGCNLCGGTGHCGQCNLCNGAGGCDPCIACGGAGNGCGFCGWRGLLNGLGHGCGGGGAASPCGGGLCGTRPGKTCGLSGHASTICPSGQAAAPPVAPIVSPQAPGPFPSAQASCTKPGCLLKMRHFHRMGKGCGACNGQGCGLCQGGGMASGKLCGACGGGGCGLCGGLGLLHHGDPCSACGGRGCKQCCPACLGHGGKHCCGNLLGLLGKVLHIGDIDYFLGPGGPVPLTPGYVPYVVTTRSPRDFFAFPPFSPLDP